MPGSQPPFFIQKMVVPFGWQTLTKKMVVGEPTLKKWWLDFQGYSKGRKRPLRKAYVHHPSCKMEFCHEFVHPPIYNRFSETELGHFRWDKKKSNILETGVGTFMSILYIPLKPRYTVFPVCPKKKKWGTNSYVFHDLSLHPFLTWWSVAPSITITAFVLTKICQVMRWRTKRRCFHGVKPGLLNYIYLEPYWWPPVLIEIWALFWGSWPSKIGGSFWVLGTPCFQTSNIKNLGCLPLSSQLSRLLQKLKKRIWALNVWFLGMEG